MKINQIDSLFNGFSIDLPTQYTDLIHSSKLNIKQTTTKILSKKK